METKDDTIIILALLLLRELLQYSHYPPEVRSAISRRATELIEIMQSKYPR